MTETTHMPQGPWWVAPPVWLVRGRLPLLARLAITAEFIIAALGKALGWSGQAAYMASQRMTMIDPLLGAALLIESVGSLCLITGVKARSAAAIMSSTSES
jgi:uncharacterized membrane protein YphA (DoxX/SURF4 family)